jgi:hypothetical protein
MDSNNYTEYRLPLWARIFFRAFGIIAIIGALFLVYSGIKSQSKDAILLLSISDSIILIIAASSIYYGASWRLLVSDKDIIHKEFIFKKRLLREDIFGCKVTPNYFIIEPRDKSLPRLKIDQMVERREELVKWLSERFRYVDEDDFDRKLNEERHLKD